MSRSLSRPGAAAAALFPVLVVASIAFADRPVADFVHAAFHGDRVFVWLTWIAEPVGPLSIVVLAAAGVAALGGRMPEGGTRVMVDAAVASLLAIAMVSQFKLAFGRAWPETWVADNPSWIRDGVYGFFPFHGGTGWTSFPSGHTATIAAPMAVFWSGFPRVRLLWPALVLLVAIGLLGADFHFLGDVLAGAWLGGVCGFGVSLFSSGSISARPPA